MTNARDLGHLALAGGRRVACGVLLRGGDLANLSAAGCSEFARLGIKTVVDLRSAATFASMPASSCVGAAAKVVNAAMPKLLPPTADTYKALLAEKAAVLKMFTALSRPKALPAYLHCVIGRDRVSGATALVLLALGADQATVVREFERSNAAGITVQRGWIEALLAEITRRGGIETYLTSVGVTSEQLKTLRQAAGEPVPHQ